MKLKRIILVILLLCSCVVVNARDAVDAREYRLQKRFRAPDVTHYAPQGFWNDSYVLFGASAFAPLAENFSFGPTAFAGMGYQFDRYNYLEVSAPYGFCRDRFYDVVQRHAGLTATYKFNVISYFMGYNRFRCCELYLLGGVQGYFTNASFNPGAHLGVDLSFSVVRNMEFFFQPEFLFNYDNYSTAHAPNWKHFRPVLDARVGLRFHLHPWVEPVDTDRHPFYVYASAGTQLQNSALVHAMPWRYRFGYAVQLGAGRQCTDCLDLRAHLDYGRSNWNISELGRILPCDYFLVGADAMLDVIGLFSSRTHRVDISLLAGPRAGVIRKHGDSGTAMLSYTIGADMGIKTGIKLGSGFKLMIERTVTFLPYSAKSYDVVYNGERKNYYDALLNVKLGLSYALPAHKPAR